jgi:hypothetical protein
MIVPALLLAGRADSAARPGQVGSVGMTPKDRVVSASPLDVHSGDFLTIYVYRNIKKMSCP